MPFPEREYYSLEHLTRRWAVTLEEVQHAIATGKLIASAWLQPTFAYTVTEYLPDEARRSAPTRLRDTSVSRQNPAESCSRVAASDGASSPPAKKIATT